MASLKNSLMPSARDCSQPFGPARFGPYRLPSLATALRSYMTMKRTEIMSRTKTTRTLTTTITQTCQVSPWEKTGSPW